MEFRNLPIISYDKNSKNYEKKLNFFLNRNLFINKEIYDTLMMVILWHLLQKK